MTMSPVQSRHLLRASLAQHFLLKVSREKSLSPDNQVRNLSACSPTSCEGTPAAHRATFLSLNKLGRLEASDVVPKHRLKASRKWARRGGDGAMRSLEPDMESLASS